MELKVNGHKALDNILVGCESVVELTNIITWCCLQKIAQGTFARQHVTHVIPRNLAQGDRVYNLIVNFVKLAQLLDTCDNLLACRLMNPVQF
jgi:hypothetical protein